MIDLNKLTPAELAEFEQLEDVPYCRCGGGCRECNYTGHEIIIPLKYGEATNQALPTASIQHE